MIETTNENSNTKHEQGDIARSGDNCIKEPIMITFCTNNNKSRTYLRDDVVAKSVYVPPEIVKLF